MYKWDKYHQHDSKNPTFSSSLLDKINKSLKTNSKTNDIPQDLTFFKPTKEGTKLEDEKMATLRRSSLVEKWIMEKKVSEKVTKKSSKVKSCNNNNNTLLEEFDVQDTLFFSTTSTSSSSSEADYFGYTHPRLQQHQQQKPRVTCFAPPMPKSVKTRQIESKFLEKTEEKYTSNVKDTKLLKSKSRGVNIYSNMKNLKQPISPGVRLTSFINSLFTKESKNKSKSKNNKSNNDDIVTKPEKITTTSFSACTTPSSYARSCFSNNNKEKKFQDDHGVKRTVRFCPVSVILDEDSRPCGQKSVLQDGYDRNLTSKFARTLSKRYEELRVLNGLERKNDGLEGNDTKKLEEVALDLLGGYCWDSRLRRDTHDQCDNKGEDNDGNYVDNQGVNYVQGETNYDYNDDNDDDDGLSCSSSDLFELDHLSLLGNDELPVYETTRFDPKLH